MIFCLHTLLLGQPQISDLRGGSKVDLFQAIGITTAIYVLLDIWPNQIWNFTAQCIQE